MSRPLSEINVEYNQLCAQLGDQAIRLETLEKDYAVKVDAFNSKIEELKNKLQDLIIEGAKAAQAEAPANG